MSHTIANRENAALSCHGSAFLDVENPQASLLVLSIPCKRLKPLLSNKRVEVIIIFCFTVTVKKKVPCILVRLPNMLYTGIIIIIIYIIFSIIQFQFPFRSLIWREEMLVQFLCVGPLCFQISVNTISNNFLCLSLSLFMFLIF